MEVDNGWILKINISSFRRKRKKVATSGEENNNESESDVVCYERDNEESESGNLICYEEDSQALYWCRESLYQSIQWNKSKILWEWVSYLIPPDVRPTSGSTCGEINSQILDDA